MSILVTGGAGFIGSNFVLDWLAERDEPVVVLDSLSYAGNLANLARYRSDPRLSFVHGSIGDGALVRALLERHDVRAVLNFAAESHVDRSIAGPLPFYETNVMGTLHLLEEVRAHLGAISAEKRTAFRLLHVSTDEVYGTLGPNDPAFSETNPYRPNSPYAASKAASDHAVRAYRETWGLPAIITNCSNNYGPFQFPEKLIPLIIANALGGKKLPIYGDGLQVRDWLFVSEHCSALRRVLDAGVPGETYNIGGNSECTNIEIVRTLCGLLDERRPRRDGLSYATQITHVADRPGHDRRYAIDARKIEAELGWRPEVTIKAGLAATVDWYLSNAEWVEGVTSGAYRDWMARQYA